jgi:hypothetical protein
MADQFDDSIIEAARSAKTAASNRYLDVMERLRRSYHRVGVSADLAAKSRSAVKRSNDLLAKTALESLHQDKNEN